MKYLIALSIFLTSCFFTNAQSVKILTSGTKTSLRGLSAVDDNVVWVSGSGGMVGKSTNGGESWKWFTVAGFSKTEFRDIEAFDSLNAIVIAIDSPAIILKTTDGGINWKPVYRNDAKGMFLDAMEFSDRKNGIVLGDPINGRFFLATTKDGGNTWTDVPLEKRPVAEPGEACFASSGTNIRALKKKKYAFITGGMTSHYINEKKRILLPVLQGKESTGANSLAIRTKKNMMIVGGDFNLKDSSSKNSFITEDGGLTWTAPIIPPHGYRSCVEYFNNNAVLTCGLSGTDISNDNGKTFTLIGTVSFHVCRKAKSGNGVFLAGGNGRIGKLLYAK